jgi:Uma2 family endonuclease
MRRMATELTRRLFTVDEYHRMAEAGILGEDDRVELLDGEIVEMTPIGSRHAGCVKRLARLLIEKLGSQAVVGIHDPVVLDDLSEPQPDISVARPREDTYSRAHPRPADLLLLIQVAESSLDPDRTRKIPRYGRAGIPETWLVDLEAAWIELYRVPGPDGYADRTSAARGDTLTPQAFPNISIEVDEVLGPR